MGSSTDFRTRLRMVGLTVSLHHPQVNQLITYHRYLCVRFHPAFSINIITGNCLLVRRFYPDGTVLSLLANEGKDPQQVIASLKPTLREKVITLSSTPPLCHNTHVSHSTTCHFYVYLRASSWALGHSQDPHYTSPI